jgi:hypothetical protein
MNKSIERRFPWVYKIEEYSADELIQILLKKINKTNWILNIPIAKLTDILEENKRFFNNFGSDIKTFLSKCKILHSKRILNTNEEKFIINENDIINCIEFLKETNPEEDLNCFLYL